MRIAGVDDRQSRVRLVRRGDRNPAFPAGHLVILALLESERVDVERQRSVLIRDEDSHVREASEHADRYPLENHNGRVAATSAPARSDVPSRARSTDPFR